MKSEYLGVFATAEEAALASRATGLVGHRGGGAGRGGCRPELALLKEFQKRGEAPTRQQVVSERALNREKQMLRDWARGLGVTDLSFHVTSIEANKDLYVFMRGGMWDVRKKMTAEQLQRGLTSRSRRPAALQGVAGGDRPSRRRSS